MNSKAVPEDRGDMRNMPLSAAVLRTQSPHVPCTQLPTLPNTVTIPEKNFQPAFLIPSSTEGCSCKAAGQTQSLLE